jgi:hypothetical protein
MTAEITRLLDNEAYRRARNDPIEERTRTKVLVQQTGLAYGYIANLVAKMRREHERKMSYVNIEPSA